MIRCVNFCFNCAITQKSIPSTKPRDSFNPQPPTHTHTHTHTHLLMVLYEDLYYYVLKLDVHDGCDRLLLWAEQSRPKDHAQVGDGHQVLLVVAGNTVQVGQTERQRENHFTIFQLLVLVFTACDWRVSVVLDGLHFSWVSRMNWLTEEPLRQSCSHWCDKPSDLIWTEWDKELRCLFNHSTYKTGVIH